MSFFFHLPAFALTDIKVFGADAEIIPTVQSAVERSLAGNYMGIFPRDSTLIYPKADIVAHIKSTSARVLDVAVSRDGLHGLVVTVSQKIPSATVCQTLPDFYDNRFIFDQMSGCYLADASGFLFEKAPPANASSSLDSDVLAHPVYYIPDSASLSDQVGSYATSTAEFKTLQSFIAGTISLGIPAQAVLIKDDGEYELYASTTVIYFNDKSGLPEELAHLIAFLTNTKGRFDYIDLRYGNNVIYKLVK
jgi:hypothetical protein